MIDTSLVSRSFAAIAPRGREMVAHFYEELFRRNPDFRPLFENTDMADQHRMLWSALVLSVESLEQPHELTERLHRIGEAHTTAGVTADHFGPFVDCLLDSMAQFAGDGWSDDVEAAWREAIRLVGDTVREGMTGGRG